VWTVRLNPAEKAVLVAALAALADGQSRRFQDLLWLGFGDRWTLIEASLLRHNQVRVVDHGHNTFAITDLGCELLAGLTGVEQRAAS
jgi:hypothetical protein